MQSFGTKLNRVRIILDLTQEDLAKKAGLTAVAISFFESGKRSPCLRNIVKLCRALGCKPNALIDV